jgi:hypothetical protein
MFKSPYQPATVKQHPPADHEGWMVNGPVPYLTMVVSTFGRLLIDR